jgi:hypothetical protein
MWLYLFSGFGSLIENTTAAHGTVLSGKYFEFLETLFL